MRYGLVAFLKEKCHEIKGYSNIIGLEHLDEDKLYDIVTFTNDFENEEELKMFLIDTGLLPIEYFNGTININYYKSKNKPEYKTLLYGISFKNDKHLFNIENLKDYYTCKMTDTRFMNAFLRKFYNMLKGIEIYNGTIGYLNNYYSNPRNDFKEPIKPYLYESMEKFIEIYCTTKKHDKYVENFTNIRNLAMFAINYERRKYVQNNVTEEYPVNSSDEIETAIEYYKFLLNNGSYTEEECEAYKNAIYEYKSKLSLIRKKEQRR